MKASEAKKLLKCSYSSLHNYVKDGKIKVERIKNHHPEYVNDSVYKFAEKINGSNSTENVTICVNGKRYGFNLPPPSVLNLLDFILQEIKQEHQTETNHETNILPSKKI